MACRLSKGGVVRYDEPFRMSDSYYDPPEPSAPCPSCEASEAKLSAEHGLRDALGNGCVSEKDTDRLVREDAENVLDCVYDAVYAAVVAEGGRACQLCGECNYASD